MARREAITDVLRTIEEETDEFRRLADERFAEELQLIGWCPSPLMGILNAAMDDLEPGEIYLEVGTYGGRSLTAALKDNEVQAHVIDPMALRTGKGEIFDVWTEGVTRLGVMDRVTLHRTRTEYFHDDLPPVGVYFYDGNHDSGHTYEGLRKLEGSLSDTALIIVDDYEIFGGNMQEVFSGHELDINRPVKTDVDRWVAENQTKIESVTYTPWLNGQAIILYQR